MAESKVLKKRWCKVCGEEYFASAKDLKTHAHVEKRMEELGFVSPSKTSVLKEGLWPSGYDFDSFLSRGKDAEAIRRRLFGVGRD